MTKTPVTTLLVLLSCSACLTACKAGEAKTEVAPLPSAALPVEVARPQTGDVFASYRTTAALTAEAEASVVSRASGEITQILVEEGDTVTAGQVLARLDGQRRALELRHAEAVLAKAQSEFDRNMLLLEKNLISESAAENLRFTLESLAAGFELKKLLFSYTEIRAPISGIISSRDVKAGQHIQENDQVFAITDTAHLVAYLKIPQREISRISAGKKTTVKVDAVPHNFFDGVISRISPTIDMKDGTFRATAEIVNDQGLLVPGMFGRFSIAYETRDAVLTVPASAVMTEDGKSVVYVVEGGTATQRQVEVGLTSDQQTEVIEGLSDSDAVVVTGQQSLRNGSKIVIAEVSNNAAKS